MQPVLSRFDDYKEELISGFTGKIREARVRFESAERELKAVSPFAILERGYSVVTESGTGRLISSAADAAPGLDAEIRFHDGSATAVIQDRKMNGENE